nr:MAG TPA_asm: hypothetical protein [Caudoviricetes sp.]
MSDKKADKIRFITISFQVFQNKFTNVDFKRKVIKNA